MLTKKTLVSIVVSLGILSLVYSQLDIPDILNRLQAVNLSWFLLAVLITVPITMLTAWRLTWLVPENHTVGFWEANRLILAASTMNLALPSKMGDLVKSVFIAKRNGPNHSQSFSLVLLEKSCDLYCVLFWTMCGILIVDTELWIYDLMLFVSCSGLFIITLLYISSEFSNNLYSLVSFAIPKKVKSGTDKLKADWVEVIVQISKNRIKFAGILLFSSALWIAHFVQIWFFMLALEIDIAIVDALLLTPLVLLLGLLPFTFAGVGARDAGFIFVFSAYFDPATGASLGILTFLRYLLTGLVGIPFFTHSMAEFRKQQPEIGSPRAS